MKILSNPQSEELGQLEHQLARLRRVQTLHFGVEEVERRVHRVQERQQALYGQAQEVRGVFERKHRKAERVQLRRERRQPPQW